jgi:hypothetical protein
VAVEEMAKQDKSRVYSGAITSMLDGGRDLDAKAAFDKYSEQLTAQDRHRLERSVNSGSKMGLAQRTVDAYFSGEMERVPTGGNNWVEKRGEPVKTMADVIAKSKSIEDPEVRHAVEQMARQRFSDIKVAEKQQNENVFSAIAKRIQQHPGVDPRGLATPDEWENQITDPDVRTALIRLAFPKREPDPAAMTELMSVPLPELANYSDAAMLKHFGGRLSETQYEKALTRRDMAKKGGGDYQSVAQSDATLMSVFVKSGLGGVKPSDTLEDINKTADKRTAFMKFWDTVDRARSAEQFRTKEKVDDDTTRSMAEKAAFLLQKKVTLRNTKLEMAEDVISEIVPGYGFIKSNPKYEKAFGSLSPDEQSGGQFEMPAEFTQSLFSFANARPGTVPKGITKEQWLEKDRAAINRAYLAFFAGADNAAVKAAYLRGK